MADDISGREAMALQNAVMPIYAEHVGITQSIYAELARQQQLKAIGKFTYTVDDKEMSNPERYVVLGEEFGEVGNAINEMGTSGKGTGSIAELRAELVQVAAVAFAWCLAIDKGDA